MKKVSKLIALVMVLTMALGSLAVSASAASFNHPAGIHTLSGGINQAAAVKVGLGEMVYGNVPAGTTMYYKFLSSKSQTVFFDFTSSANVGVKVYANDPSLPVYSGSAVSSVNNASLFCDMAYYHVAITNNTGATAQVYFTTRSNDMPTEYELSCSINHRELTIVATNTKHLTLSNFNVPDLNYFWEVQDDPETPGIDERTIITVSPDGLVSVAPNSPVFNRDLKAKVQAIIYYNGIRMTKTCEVTAVPHNIFLDPYYGTSEQNKLVLAKGEKVYINFTTNYDGATIEVTASNTNCVDVKKRNASTVSIEGIGYGTSEVVFSIVGTTIKRTMLVSVPANYYAIKGVQFDKDSVTVRMGNVEALNYSFTVTPSGGTPTNTNVTFTSSNPAVATVDANGKVTPVSLGETTITIKTEQGGHTDTIKVTVQEELPDWLMLLIAPLRIIINLFALIFGN